MVADLESDRPEEVHRPASRDGAIRRSAAGGGAVRPGPRGRLHDLAGPQVEQLADLADLLMIVSLQKWLMGVTGEANLIVGMPVDIVVDKDRYDTQLQCWFKPENGRPRRPGPQGEGRGLAGPGEGDGYGRRRTAPLHLRRRPEARRLPAQALSRGETGVEPRPEARGFAFNIDTPPRGTCAASPRSSLGAGPRRLYTLGSDKFTDLKEKARKSCRKARGFS